MANTYKSWIYGVAITGSEKILPKKIYQPNIRSFREGLPFSKIAKVFLNKAEQDVIDQENGFKIYGNEKKYDSHNSIDIQSRFSWWSMDVDENVLNIIKNRNPQHPGEKPAEIYHKPFSNKSRYGTNRLTLDFDYVISKYNMCAGRNSETRVLGTFKYKREVMHALVVCPVDYEKFAKYPLVGIDEDWLKNSNGVCTYFPHSVIQYAHQAHSDKVREWCHLAFAFCLDPLTDKALVLPQVRNKSNWSQCKQSKVVVHSYLNMHNTE